MALAPSREPQSFEAGGYMNLALPPELVEAIAQRTAELVADRTDSADEAGEDGRVTLTVREAAESLGVSADHFTRHVAPELRTIRSGRLRLVPVVELRRWADENAARALR